MKTKKELIIEELEYCTDSKLELIYDLLNLPYHCDKHELIKFSKSEVKNYDTATPIDYYRRVEEIYPEFSEGNMIYDYTTFSFGSFVNINNLVVKRILNSLNI